jgi:hypothetical protein
LAANLSALVALVGGKAQGVHEAREGQEGETRQEDKADPQRSRWCFWGINIQHQKPEV